MDRLKIANEILRIAKEVMAIEFDTEQQLQEYKHTHKVRPTTKLTVKNKGQKKQNNDGKGTVQVKMTDQQKELDIKANSDNAKIREEAASNPSTHPSTLDKLMRDKDYDTRCAVGSNPNTSPKTLEKKIKLSEQI